MSILKRIIDWNIERDIPQEYKKDKEAGHIAEELSELLRANTMEDNIDAYADIIVYVTGAIWKCGYDPDKVMYEVLKHVESRKGSWNSDMGKWVKQPSEVYKPNFDICRYDK